jgi:hypothetical protein
MAKRQSWKRKAQHRIILNILWQCRDKSETEAPEVTPDWLTV